MKNFILGFASATGFAFYVGSTCAQAAHWNSGPVGVSYRHVLIITPDIRATGAEIIVNVTLEARY